jgi:RES domain-containing protein
LVYRLKKELRVYRIADDRRPIFDGAGAALLGGRWNSPGRHVIYAAETYAGALLENLVHANIGRIPKQQAYIEIVLPQGLRVEAVTAGEVPGWDDSGQEASRRFGDAWYDQQRAVALLAPAAVTRIERNVLIHQRHADFQQIEASEPRLVHWEKRLFDRG